MIFFDGEPVTRSEAASRLRAAGAPLSAIPALLDSCEFADWEPPTGKRKTWRTGEKGNYRYSKTPPKKEEAPAKPVFTDPNTFAPTTSQPLPKFQNDLASQVVSAIKDSDPHTRQVAADALMDASPPRDEEASILQAPGPAMVINGQVFSLSPELPRSIAVFPLSDLHGDGNAVRITAGGKQVDFRVSIRSGLALNHALDDIEHFRMRYDGARLEGGTFRTLVLSSHHTHVLEEGLVTGFDVAKIERGEPHSPLKASNVEGHPGVPQMRNRREAAGLGVSVPVDFADQWRDLLNEVGFVGPGGLRPEGTMFAPSHHEKKRLNRAIRLAIQYSIRPTESMRHTTRESMPAASAVNTRRAFWENGGAPLARRWVFPTSVHYERAMEAARQAGYSHQ